MRQVVFQLSNGLQVLRGRPGVDYQEDTEASLQEEFFLHTTIWKMRFCALQRVECSTNKESIGAG